jgi:hypothetical protein
MSYAKLQIKDAIIYKQTQVNSLQSEKDLLIAKLENKNNELQSAILELTDLQSALKELGG